MNMMNKFIDLVRYRLFEVQLYFELLFDRVKEFFKRKN